MCPLCFVFNFTSFVSLSLISLTCGPSCSLFPFLSVSKNYFSYPLLFVTVSVALPCVVFFFWIMLVAFLLGFPTVELKMCFLFTQFVLRFKLKTNR